MEYSRNCQQQFSLVHVAVRSSQVIGSNEHCEDFGRLNGKLPIQYPPPQVAYLITCEALQCQARL